MPEPSDLIPAESIDGAISVPMPEPSDLIPAERVAGAILLMRGQRVMLDSDLAALYGVETGALNQAVKRNADRFPPDFMFQLTQDEFSALISQSVISKGRGGRRKLPNAFSQEGIAMLSGVLNSPRAIQVNIEIMRAFVRLRGVLAANADLASKIDELEAKYGEHDRKISAILEALRRLLPAPDAVSRRRIGYRRPAGPEGDAAHG